MQRAAAIALLAASLAALAPAAASAGGGKVTVRQDETLGHIALRTGCSVDQLMAANRGVLKAPDKIWPGQELQVPRCQGRKGGKGREGRGAAGRFVRGQCDWSADDFAEGALRNKMRKRGFSPPKKFRAMVAEIRLSRGGTRVQSHRLLSYGKLASEPYGWNPASTVKLFSAIGALELLRRHRFGVKTQVTFHYRKGDRTFGIQDLFEEAVHLSKNIPHNRLVQLAGYDALNGKGGTLRRAGLEHTYIIRAYAAQQWASQGHGKRLKKSPAITLREGKRRKKLPARVGKGRYPCQGAACTTLSDLAKTMCRMMLHEQLPRRRRLRLGDDGQSQHLKLLRRAMNRKRKGRSDRVWDAFARAFPEKEGYALFRKAGFSRDWLSENIYIYNPKHRSRWIVALAGYPGRGSLTGAAKIIAALIKGGDL